MLKLLLSYCLGGVVISLCEIMSTGMITRLLSTDAYAKGMLYLSFIQMGYCVSIAGMDQVLMRFFYEPLYKNKLSLLFYRCLIIMVSLFFFLSLLIVFFQDTLAVFFDIRDPYIIYYMIIGTGIFTLYKLTILIPRLLEKSVVYNVSNTLHQIIVFSSFIFLFYFFNSNYLIIITSQLLALLFVTIGLLLYFKTELRLSRHSYPLILDKTELKSFIVYGAPSFFSLGLHLLYLNIDKLLLLKWSNYFELGIYTAAFSLVGPFIFFQSIFLTAWIPRMNAMLIHDTVTTNKAFSFVFEKLNCALFAYFILLILSKNILILYIGPAFHEAIDLFPWLLFYPYFWMLSEVVVAGVVKSKKSYLHIYFSFCAAIANTVSCYFLIPWIGSKGAAISLAISSFIFFIVRYKIAFRYYSFTMNNFKWLSYTLFIVLFILMSNQHPISYLLSMVGVIMILFFEKKWLYADLRRLAMYWPFQTKHEVNNTSQEKNDFTLPKIQDR